MPGFVVEDAVQACLQEWVDEYTTEMNRQWESCPVLPPIRSWNTRPDPIKWSEDQLPACVVVSPGVNSEPMVSGDGWYEADFLVGTVIFCAGKTEKETRNRAQAYGAAIRAILLQQRGLGGISTGVTWQTEDYTPGPTERGRTFGAVMDEFSFTIAGVVNRRMGPSEHGVTDTGPPVETTQLNVHRSIDPNDWEGD